MVLEDSGQATIMKLIVASQNDVLEYEAVAV